MIDHIGLLVSNYSASKRFYERALEPLGYGLVMEVGAAAGFGAGGKPTFWIAESGVNAPTATHIAFASPDRATVDAFYETAVAAGGRDNGAPGLRPHYHPHYYGAFVLDPDGHNIEAVCHHPE